MKKNNISFIIPAYNCEQTIKDSVNSIIETNFESGDEIVIVDDGSNDGTNKILEKICKENPEKIVVVTHKKNKGGGAARNTAIKNSKNDLIFCLDSDNLLEKNSIINLKEKLLQNKIFSAAAFKFVKYFRKDNKITHTTEYKDDFVNFEDILAGHTNPASSGNYLYYKKSWEIAGGYSENSGALDSWSLGLRQAALVGPILIVPDFGYFHRYGHKSYWIREVKKEKISEQAEAILKPFFHKINDEDVRYMQENLDWFENLAKKQIRLKNCNKGIDGTLVIKNNNIFNKIYYQIKNIIK